MPSILIVDDSKFSCKKAREMFLEESPSLDITLAFLPSEAIHLVLEERRSFDLVILDFNMPEMDGLELFDKIGERVPAHRVILLTATSAFATHSQTVPEGVRLVPKPINSDKIREILGYLA